MRHRASPPPVAGALLAALLAGCTVGPDYTRPAAAPAMATFARQDATMLAVLPLASWWEALNDPALDALEARALADNPDVAAVQARLRQARAALRLERANETPKLNPSLLYAHARLPGLSLESGNSADQGGDSGTGTGSGGGSGGNTTDTNFYNQGFDASWEIDLFGGQRRTSEAARATVGAAEADVADAAVSLAAEVAQTYVNLRDRQRRIALNALAVAKQERMLALDRQRYDQGTASKLDIAQLAGQLDTTRADNLPLSAERDAYLDALATLTGNAPGMLDATLAPARPVPLPPAHVAIGDPAGLIARRPDIRAAERTLAADTARIGVAEAARFPSISFIGIVGIGGTKPADLVDLDNFTVLAAPQLSWSFLDFGRNKARVLQADAVRDEAEAKYRGAVLAALRDAEDALSRFRYRRVTVATLARAKAEADTATELDDQRYRAGTGSLIELLDAERRQIAAEQNLSLAEAGLTGDFVAIQKALGLGWSG